MTKAILYYTSNREKPDFEKRVQENILQACGGIPIVSISQEPIDFGRNICVGDVGVSGFNMFRQVWLGCRSTDADFVISAECDCLYPPDYFAFTPDRMDQCWRDTNLYVMPDARDYYFSKKEGATHAQVIGREYYLERLEELFSGAPMWSVVEKNFPKERWHKEDVFDDVAYFTTDNPVFQIKTHRGMRYYTNSDRTPISSIPYWGDGKKARELYLHGRVI